MSMISGRNTDKLSELLKQDRKLFHIADLGLLWRITNRDTLRQTIARYIKKGTLIQIQRGFYSILPLSEIDPLELGTAVFHGFAYVSTETVLVQNGIIFQIIEPQTYCSLKRVRIKIGDTVFFSRKLADIYLYNPTGIIDTGKYKIATVERAIADMLHFNSKYYFDASNQVDWDRVSEIRKEVYGL